ALTLADADDQRSQITIGLFLHVAEGRMSVAAMQGDAVGRVESVALCLAIRVGADLLINELAQPIGEEELRRRDLAVLEDDLEMDVGRPAAIPPGIDRVEGD